MRSRANANRSANAISPPAGTSSPSTRSSTTRPSTRESKTGSMTTHWARAPARQVGGDHAGSVTSCDVSSCQTVWHDKERRLTAGLLRLWCRRGLIARSLHHWNSVCRRYRTLFYRDARAMILGQTLLCLKLDAGAGSSPKSPVVRCRTSAATAQGGTVFSRFETTGAMIVS